MLQHDISTDAYNEYTFQFDALPTPGIHIYSDGRVKIAMLRVESGRKQLDFTFNTATQVNLFFDASLDSLRIRGEGPLCIDGDIEVVSHCILNMGSVNVMGNFTCLGRFDASLAHGMGVVDNVTLRGASKIRVSKLEIDPGSAFVCEHASLKIQEVLSVKAKLEMSGRINAPHIEFSGEAQCDLRAVTVTTRCWHVSAGASATLQETKVECSGPVEWLDAVVIIRRSNVNADSVTSCGTRASLRSSGFKARKYMLFDTPVQALRTRVEAPDVSLKGVELLDGVEEPVDASSLFALFAGATSALKLAGVSYEQLHARTDTLALRGPSAGDTLQLNDCRILANTKDRSGQVRLVRATISRVEGFEGPAAPAFDIGSGKIELIESRVLSNNHTVESAGAEVTLEQKSAQSCGTQYSRAKTLVSSASCFAPEKLQQTAGGVEVRGERSRVQVATGASFKGADFTIEDHAAAAAGSLYTDAELTLDSGALRVDSTFGQAPTGTANIRQGELSAETAGVLGTLRVTAGACRADHLDVLGTVSLDDSSALTGRPAEQKEVGDDTADATPPPPGVKLFIAKGGEFWAASKSTTKASEVMSAGQVALDDATMLVDDAFETVPASETRLVGAVVKSKKAEIFGNVHAETKVTPALEEESEKKQPAALLAQKSIAMKATCHVGGDGICIDAPHIENDAVISLSDFFRAEGKRFNNYSTLAAGESIYLGFDDWVVNALGDMSATDVTVHSNMFNLFGGVSARGTYSQAGVVGLNLGVTASTVSQTSSLISLNFGLNLPHLPTWKTFKSPSYWWNAARTVATNVLPSNWTNAINIASAFVPGTFGLVKDMWTDTRIKGWEGFKKHTSLAELSRICQPVRGLVENYNAYVKHQQEVEQGRAKPMRRHQVFARLAQGVSGLKGIYSIGKGFRGSDSNKQTGDSRGLWTKFKSGSGQAALSFLGTHTNDSLLQWNAGADMSPNVINNSVYSLNTGASMGWSHHTTTLWGRNSGAIIGGHVSYNSVYDTTNTGDVFGWQNASVRARSFRNATGASVSSKNLVLDVKNLVDNDGSLVGTSGFNLSAEFLRNRAAGKIRGYRAQLHIQKGLNEGGSVYLNGQPRTLTQATPSAAEQQASAGTGVQAQVTFDEWTDGMGASTVFENLAVNGKRYNIADSGSTYFLASHIKLDELQQLGSLDARISHLDVGHWHGQENSASSLAQCYVTGQRYDLDGSLHARETFFDFDKCAGGITVGSSGQAQLDHCAYRGNFLHDYGRVSGAGTDIFTYGVIKQEGVLGLKSGSLNCQTLLRGAGSSTCLSDTTGFTQRMLRSAQWKYDCAALSDAAYCKDDLEAMDRNPDWELVHRSDEYFTEYESTYISVSIGPFWKTFKNDDKGGYFAATYRHKETGKLCIAHRGTEFDRHKNIVSDAALAVGKEPKCAALADEYTKFVTQQFGQVPHHTGHSLGGARAILSAVKNESEFTVYDAANVDGILKRQGYDDCVSHECRNYYFHPNVINWKTENSPKYHEELPWLPEHVEEFGKLTFPRACRAFVPFLNNLYDNAALFHGIANFTKHFSTCRDDELNCPQSSLLPPIASSDFKPEMIPWVGVPTCPVDAELKEAEVSLLDLNMEKVD